MAQKKPKPNGVTNVVNTGVRQTATQTTGSTGSVSNVIRTTSSTGANGAPGTPATSFIPPATQALINEHVTAARTHASASTAEAFSRATGHIAQVRQQALASVPAEYRDRVNEHFDRAGESIEKMRKKALGD